jgi:hypothetical protein
MAAGRDDILFLLTSGPAFPKFATCNFFLGLAACSKLGAERRRGSRGAAAANDDDDDDDDDE